MAIRSYNPTSPGRRFQTVSTFEEITSTTPERSLLGTIKKTGGRNNNGRVTSRHRGGGHKRRYRGGKLVRSAGASAQLMAREGKYAQVRLASGEMRLVLAQCRATIGQVGNVDHENISIGKAGRARWLGRRPRVRGVAMNPVDHPHGGGEGKTSGGRHPVTPWGVPTKGYKTRRNKRTSKFIVRRRK